MLFRASSAFTAMWNCHLHPWYLKANCILSIKNPLLFFLRHNPDQQLVHVIGNTDQVVHHLTGCLTHERRKAVPEERRPFAVVSPNCSGYAQTARRYRALATLLSTNKLNFNGIFWQQHRWALRHGHFPDTPKDNLKGVDVEHRVPGHAGSSLEEAQCAASLPPALRRHKFNHTGNKSQTGLLWSSKREFKMETWNIVVLPRVAAVSCICC